jgi:uncharacterized membrane protein
MRKRPPSITVISWLFIVVGIVALLYHLQHPFEEGLVWVCCVRVLAVVCGVFMLRGSNWARWLLVVWIGYHIVLSALHSLFEVVIHSLLFGVVVYFLFRRQAAAYFRGAKGEPLQNRTTDGKPTV